MEFPRFAHLWHVWPGHLAAWGPEPGGLGRPCWPAKNHEIISSDTGDRKMASRIWIENFVSAIRSLKPPCGEDSCGPPLGQPWGLGRPRWPAKSHGNHLIRRGDSGKVAS
eukprot:gene13811-biopygen3548